MKGMIHIRIINTYEMAVTLLLNLICNVEEDREEEDNFRNNLYATVLLHRRKCNECGSAGISSVLMRAKPIGRS